MRSINRFAIVVRPRPAFFEWASSLDGERMKSPENWCSAYLVGAPENDEPQAILQRHFQRVFKEQLESWHTRESDWPPRRTFAMFRNWFVRRGAM